VAPATRRFGPYDLLEKLGQGAMGDAWLARPVNDRRGVPSPVVVKRLHGELAEKEQFIARFKHEADIAVLVDSPHVARVFDAGLVGETLYIAMEFIGGWPLSKFLQALSKRKHRTSVPAVAELLAGGLRGMGALHSAVDVKGRPLGIVHRDVSPKNLMLGDDGSMRIIDLGLGKSSHQDWRTATGLVMGSVGYMPPEQVLGERVDARADLYAMGVVLYEALTLRSFIRRGPIPVMLQASRRPELRKPSETRSDVPPALDDVVFKAMQPDAQDRFQTAEDFLAALHHAVPNAAHKDGVHMQRLVDEVFGPDIVRRHEEIRSLIAQPPLDQEPEMEKTAVFAMAPGVAPIDDLYEPTRISGSHPEPPATAMQVRPADDAQTAVTPISFEGSPQRALHSAAVYTPGEQKGVPLGAVIAALIVTLGVGMALGSWLLGPRAAPPGEPLLLAPTSEPTTPSSPGAVRGVATTPTARPAAVPAPRATANNTSSKRRSGTAPPTNRRPRKSRRPRPASVAPPKPAPPKPASPKSAPQAPTEASNTRLARQLLRRAKVLKSGLPADGTEHHSVDALRTKISMELGSTNVQQTADRLKGLSKDLERLAKSAQKNVNLD
jgi:eukaryotic-like serine/threonine-protein kinase